jgi:hypothetical protein
MSERERERAEEPGRDAAPGAMEAVAECACGHDRFKLLAVGAHQFEVRCGRCGAWIASFTAS